MPTPKRYPAQEYTSLTEVDSAEMRAIADEHNVPISAIIRVAVEQYLAGRRAAQRQPADAVLSEEIVARLRDMSPEGLSDTASAVHAAVTSATRAGAEEVIVLGNTLPVHTARTLLELLRLEHRQRMTVTTAARAGRIV
jgi:hypothetical protein